MEYATAELMEECITVEGLVQESAKWPDGFNLEGPDDDGKYFFVRKPGKKGKCPNGNAKGRGAEKVRDEFDGILVQRKREREEEKAAQAARDEAARRRDHRAEVREEREMAQMESNAKREDERLQLLKSEFEHRAKMEVARLEAEKVESERRHHRVLGTFAPPRSELGLL
mmetsp:Transcript_18004/g.50543  ORF Transcript_18004/g.50543 Transcript_18004/m.50543 type:complete len:170 (-) Transcript_18004:8-517(-)